MLVNPGDQAAGLTVAAYDNTGNPLPALAPPGALGAYEKLSGYTTDWFDFSGVNEGWIEVVSSGPALAGATFIDRATPGGLAAVPAADALDAMILPHYVSSDQWWTLFALANPGMQAPANVAITAYGDDGTLGETVGVNVPIRGHKAHYVGDIFTVP